MDITMTVKPEYDFDSILHRVGRMGKYQILHVSLLGLSLITSGFFNLANAFFGVVPPYWCDYGNSSTTAVSIGDNTSGYHHIREVHENIPENECSLDEYTVALNGSSVGSLHPAGCPRWLFDTSVHGETVATEWEFVCSREWLASLSQTTYMVGFLFGGLWVGAISDRYGRKVAWIVNLLLMALSGSLASFMPNYWAFIAVRMFSALSSTSVFISTFVMVTELVTQDQRMFQSILLNAWFATGIMGLAVAAYFLRNFRHLALFIGLAPVIFIPFYWVLDESPRWLMAKERFDRAHRVLARVARMNGKTYPADLIEQETHKLLKEKAVSSGVVVKYSVLDLVRTPNMRYKFLTISYAWFLCSLVYYGLSLGAFSLFGGPHLNLFISGAVEFPAFVLCYFGLNLVGRKWSMATSLFVAGFCCLAMAACESVPIAKMVFSQIGKMGISGSFVVVFLYTSELFPTVVRTIAVGGGSMCSRVAGILAPNVALLGAYWSPLPYVIFGSLTVVGGFLTLLLPETLHQPYPETLEDGENFGKCSYKTMCECPFKNRIKQEQEVGAKDGDDSDVTECDAINDAQC